MHAGINVEPRTWRQSRRIRMPAHLQPLRMTPAWLVTPDSADILAHVPWIPAISSPELAALSWKLHFCIAVVVVVVIVVAAATQVNANISHFSYENCQMYSKMCAACEILLNMYVSVGSPVLYLDSDANQRCRDFIPQNHMAKSCETGLSYTNETSLAFKYMKYKAFSGFYIGWAPQKLDILDYI